MIQRLTLREAVAKLVENAPDAELVEIGEMLLLSTKRPCAVKPLRQTLPVIERHAGDLEDAHYRHLEAVSRSPAIPRGHPTPPARHLAPEDRAPHADASGVFSSPMPAVFPLTDHSPDGAPATRGTILPSGTSSRRASLWSRFLA